MVTEEQRTPATRWDEQRISEYEQRSMPVGFRPGVLRWCWLLSVIGILGGLALWLAAW